MTVAEGVRQPSREQLEALVVTAVETCDALASRGGTFTMSMITDPVDRLRDQLRAASLPVQPLRFGE